MTIHIVKSGETVYSIAKEYGVSAQRIISDNAISNPQYLVVGQAILVLIPRTIYTVVQGDTLQSIATKFNTTVSVLLQNNPSLINSAYLQSDEQIVIDFDNDKQAAISVNGYAYTYIKPNLLRSVLPYLTYLTIFGYGFTLEGNLIEPNDSPIIELAYEFKTAPIMLISSMTEEGNFSSRHASELFNNADLQKKVIDNILVTMQNKGYVGLDVDFEYVESKDADAFIGFIENVTARLHANGFFVNVDLAPKTSDNQSGLLYEAHDYAQIGDIADRVFLMTYEWGYMFGPPMAVAPLNKVQQVVNYSTTRIRPDKIMLGIPSYGYDWALPFVQGTTQAVIVGNNYAVELAQRYNAEIKFDTVAQSPFFNYTDAQGIRHVVWFEDARSINKKLELIDSFNLRGCGYWNLMRPFTQNWHLLAATYNIRKPVA